MSSNTQGGTTYLQRILKAAQDNKQITVIVNRGNFQEAVFRTIERQMALLHAVATIDFTYSITMEV